MSSTPVSRVRYFGSFEVDLQAGELRRQGLKVRLQEQPLQVLGMLLERPAELITREEIRNKLWPADTFVDFDRGMNNAVNRLREALGDSAETPRFIETVPRKGYRFIAPVNGSERQLGHPVATRSRLLTAVLVGVVAVSAVVFSLSKTRVYDLFGKAPLAPIHSIVVLPFGNLSGDPSHDYLADGMADTLITNLAGIHSLRVISRTSAMHYKGTHKVVPEIARELNVDVVVEGSVVRSGNQVRVTAQLIHAATDRHLWAGSYERKLEDLLPLQREIALEIARKVSASLTAREQLRLSHGERISGDAQDAYLHGRYLLNLRNHESIDRAPEDFRLAIQKAPRFAAAYSGLADSYLLLWGWGHVSRNAIRNKALWAIREALKIDDESSEAHASLAYYKLEFERDQEGIEREFRRALSLNPNNSGAHKLYGLFLMQSGRFEEAIAEEMHAQKLDPLAAHLRLSAAHVFYESGRYDRAIAELGRALEIEPTFQFVHDWIGWAYARQGMREEAARKWLECWAPNPKVWAVLHRAHSASGYEGLLRAQLGKDFANAFLPGQPPAEFTSYYHRAVVYSELDEQNKALDSLAEAVKRQEDDLVELPVDPNLEKLHSDPRFKELVRRCRAECDTVRPFASQYITTETSPPITGDKSPL